MKMRFDCDDDGILIRVSRKKKKTNSKATGQSLEDHENRKTKKKILFTTKKINEKKTTKT